MQNPSFELRARQSLALTPRLQQSVRLLQLSAMEFAQELQQALANNPFLEDDESHNDEATDNSDSGHTEAHLADNGVATLDTATTNESDQASEFSSDSTDAASESESLDDYSTYNDCDSDAIHGPRGTADGDDNDVNEWMHSLPSLHEHLHLELRNFRLSERDKVLAQIIIDALDDDGYLRQDLSELVALLANDSPVTEEELQIALMLVQQLDPAGVGARNVSECLALQLEALPGSTAGRALALGIVRDHLQKLARRDFAELQRLHQADAESVRIACNLIRSLDPRPGVRFGRDQADYVVPDVIVRKVKGHWSASINPAVLPKTRIHHTYATMFAQARGHNRSPLAQQLQEARWLIRNSEQRFATIHRVAESIVAHQRTFFEYGEIAMKPLVLRDVAEELGLHESTVSRATGNKYMATPRGIFEFKHFFSRQLATESGGSCSAAAVRALLKEMISAEKSADPLSDVSLTRMLADQGVIVARRTVAKYRGLMKLPSAELRREA